MGTKMAHLRSHIGNVEPIHQGEDSSIEGRQRLRRTGHTNLTGIFPERSHRAGNEDDFRRANGLVVKRAGVRRWLSCEADWSGHRRPPRVLCPHLSPSVVSERLVPPPPTRPQPTHSSGCCSTVRGLPAARALFAPFWHSATPVARHQGRQRNRPGPDTSAADSFSRWSGNTPDTHAHRRTTSFGCAWHRY